MLYERLDGAILEFVEETHVGDQLVAIGNPFGLIDTTTSGIVSALHRTFTALNEHKVSNAIQTDAAINGGTAQGARS